MNLYAIRLATRANRNGAAMLTVALLMVQIFATQGCAVWTVSPHENFKAALYGRSPWSPRIGQNIDRTPRGIFPVSEDLMEIHQLPNGNVEMKYRWWRSCRYFYEVEPKTRKIVGARFEGSEDDCRLIP